MRRRFANPDPAHRPHSLAEVLRWAIVDRLTGRRRIPPPGPAAPRTAPDLEAIHAQDDVPRLTWIGHASFLGRLGGAAFLIDPVFSRRVAVVRRHVPPGLEPTQLPALDAVLITHAHYDHLDAGSLRALDRSTPVVVPLGLGAWCRRRGFGDVTELDWWGESTVGRLRVTLVPARHWSRRGLTDTNRTLWGGFVIQVGEEAVYHAGDTGRFDGFEAIGQRFPGLLAAMLPIGAYAPAWFMEPNHMNPEQALEAFLSLGAQHLVPMHWGTFRLTDEPLVEPRERLMAAWAARGDVDARRLDVLAVGETLALRPRAAAGRETR